jgi:hypothetical protein
MTYSVLAGLILLTTLCLIPNDCIAQNGYILGGLPGSAMRMGFGATGMSLGNSMGAVTNEAGLSYYNPAIVPFQTERTAYISTGFLSLDRSLNSLSYTQSVQPSGGFSLAIVNAGVSNLDGRNSDGVQSETYSTSENEFLLSFGTKLHPDFSIGVTAKILYFSLFQGVKSTTVGFDLGVLYRPNQEWCFGIVLGDINSKYKWDTSTLYGQDGTTTIERFPLRRRFAVLYSPTFITISLTGELEWIGSAWLTRYGLALPLHEAFALRAGLDQVVFDGSVSAKPSAGFSLKAGVGSWHPILTYGYVIEPYSPAGIHMLSLSVGFQ